MTDDVKPKQQTDEAQRLQYGRRLLNAFMQHDDFASLEQLSGVGPTVLQSAKDLGWATSQELDGQTIVFLTDEGRYRRRLRQTQRNAAAVWPSNSKVVPANTADYEDEEDDDAPWDEIGSTDWLEIISGHLGRLNVKFDTFLEHALPILKHKNQPSKQPALVADDEEEVWDDDDWDTDEEEDVAYRTFLFDGRQWRVTSNGVLSSTLKGLDLTVRPTDTGWLWRVWHGDRCECAHEVSYTASGNTQQKAIQAAVSAALVTAADLNKENA